MAVMWERRIFGLVRFSLGMGAFALCAVAQSYEVLDVQSVRIMGDPKGWVRTVTAPAEPETVTCDILVAGAGSGGVAAALRAALRGNSVCLTEETDEIGGQFASVPALDENRFIEFSGGTRTYYEMRRRIRNYYRDRYRLAPEVADQENLNPGACYVSPLCSEPPVVVNAVQEMLAPHQSRIRTFPRTKIIDLDVNSGAIESALAYRFEQQDVIRIRAKYYLDGTELGDLLPLAGVPYVVGSEAQSDTNEPDAADDANAACVQSFTYTFVIEHRPGEDHTIPKPPDYEKFRDGQPFSMLFNYSKRHGWKGEVQYKMFGDDPPIPNNQSPRPFFSWRRVLASKNIAGPNPPNDLALINWPRQDYKDESLLDRTPREQARILQQAKRLAHSFLYWLQVDLERDDGEEKGYPELMLRRDQMGSADGLSKYPYIRESRRIRARSRVVEQDIVDQYQKGSRAKWFGDSVGTAFYMVDIHPCGANELGRMMMPRPFQIPMGTLIPRGVSNLLPAGKNIGVTHLTNGAYRLHPVEWNVGEAAAVIASLGIAQGRLPDARDVQRELVEAGVQLVWFDDLPVDHPAFPVIQLAALKGIYPLSEHDLHAVPDAPVTRGEAARALTAHFGRDASGPGSGRLDVPADHRHARAIDIAVEEGWMAVDHRNWFHPGIPFYWTDWREGQMPEALSAPKTTRTGPIKRSELAERLVSRR
jgi:hypothetical protein